MFVYPKVSEASTTKSSFAAGSDTTKTYTFVNPEIRSTKATIRVQDGETMVLGGLIRKQNSTVITKLPVLGDIPFFGALFRHKSVNPGKDRELLVFITPRIIKDSGSINAKAQGVQQAKKIMLPPREQSTVSVISRQSSMNTYMNALDKQR
jgi:type II secretory pathway component GspD/PulD (secretin)